MTRKYFFFDYDGTLALFHTRTIPQSTYETIDRLRANGHFVGLATGRLQVDAMDLVESARIKSLIADGGNSVTLHGELKWMESMPIENCRQLLHHLDAIGRPWAVITKNEMLRYTPDSRFIDDLPDDYCETVVDPSLSIDDLDCIYKIFIPSPLGEEDGFEFFGVPFARYNPTCIFCEPTDKSIGIKKLMDMLDAPYEDVVVFGDGLNDLKMFRDEWTSIAMGNAREKLKERADYITDPVDRDGIRTACERFGWI